MRTRLSPLLSTQQAALDTEQKSIPEPRGNSQTVQPSQDQHPESDVFFIDTQGEPPKSPASVDYTPFSAKISSGLDSSEDEVVFSGRRGARSTSSTAGNSRVRPNDVAKPVTVKIFEESTWFPSETFTERTTEPAKSTLQSAKKARKDTVSYDNSLTHKKSWGKNLIQKDDTAILMDYVENMDPEYTWSDSSSSGDESDLSDGHRVESYGAMMLDSSNNATGKVSKAERAISKKSKGSTSLVKSSRLAKSGFTRQGLMQSKENSTEEESDDTDDSSSLGDLVSYFQHQPLPGGPKARKQAHKFAADTEDFLDLEGYGRFDIMDFERGSLRKKKGNRRLDFGLSDSDIERHLEQSWEKDRSKKKARKQEREQLRAQGLLGRKQKSTSTHGAGIGIEEVKIQIKNFLLSPAESLDLPPMRKKQRRLVHEMANAVSLKSQSRGKGFVRYPVMYKTARTPNFNGKHSVKLDKILSQPRFIQQGNGRTNHQDKEPKKGKRPQHKGDVSYLEGDVVGGTAPEIGADNRGRAMLEKMGWSTGTALGAMNNKGILQPVTHVMKNSRAGLG